MLKLQTKHAVSLLVLAALVLGNNCSNQTFQAASSSDGGAIGSDGVGADSGTDSDSPAEVPRPAAGEWDLCPATNVYKSTHFYPKQLGGSTDEIGPLADGTMIVIKMAIPLDAKVQFNQMYGSSIYGGGQAMRTWSVSKTACDLDPSHAVVDRVNSTAKHPSVLWRQQISEVTFSYSVGDDPTKDTLIRGQTYYLNIRGDSGCDNPILGHCPLESIKLP